MGYYIQVPRNRAKARYLRDVHGARLISPPKVFDPPPGEALICVAEGGMFDAAAYCFDGREFEAFTLPDDKRHKTWLLMDKKLAEELSGYRR
jgi:hypothetical protein